MGERIIYFLFRPDQTLQYTYVWVTPEGVRTQGSNFQPEAFVSQCGHFQVGDWVTVNELNATGVLTFEGEDVTIEYDTFQVEDDD